jgi:hypothetical protein
MTFVMALRGRRSSSIARREYLEPVSLRDKAVLFADAITEGDQLGEFDGDHFLRVDADEQVAMGSAVDELPARLLSIEENLLDDPGVLEQFQGAIDGRLADAEPRLAKLILQLVRLENVIELDDRIENLCTFGSVFLPFFFKTSAKDRAQWLADHNFRCRWSIFAGAGHSTHCTAFARSCVLRNRRVVRETDQQLSVGLKRVA